MKSYKRRKIRLKLYKMIILYQSLNHQAQNLIRCLFYYTFKKMLRIILYALVQIKSHPKIYIPNIPGVKKGVFFQLRPHLVANFWPSTPRNENSTSVEILFVIFFPEYFRLLSFTPVQTTSCVTFLRYFFYFVFILFLNPMHFFPCVFVWCVMKQSG